MAHVPPGMVMVAAGAILAAGLVVAMVVRTRLLDGDASPRTELTFYQVAYLAGGPARVADTALAFLVWSGLVEIRDRTGMLALRSEPRQDAHLTPVEAVIVSNLSLEGGRPDLAMTAARYAARHLDEELEGLVTSRRSRRMWLMAMLAPAALVAAGTCGWMIARLAVGADVALVPAVTLAAVAMALVAFLDQPWLSRSGRRALGRQRDAVEEWMESASVGVTSLPVEDAMYVVALFGREAMNGGLAPVRRVLGSG